jgi:hypothetical protein
MKDFRFRYRREFSALVLVAVWVGIFWAPSALAGNSDMVAERTEELEEINRQAVSRIPEELPQEGQIEIKADVVQEKGETKVEVQDYSIRRGKIARKNQTQIGSEAAKAKGAIPRYDPSKQ